MSFFCNLIFLQILPFQQASQPKVQTERVSTLHNLHFYNFPKKSMETDKCAPVGSNCCVFVTLSLYQTWPLGTQKESTTIPPDPRGDTSGPGIDEVGFYTMTLNL